MVQGGQGRSVLATVAHPEADAGPAALPYCQLKAFAICFTSSVGEEEVGGKRVIHT